MRFFIPNIESIEEAEKQYRTTKRVIEYHFGPVLETRIRSIRFHENGETIRAIVGEREPSKRREIVIAIFELKRKSSYLVCTPTRGMLRGLPFLVEKVEVRHVEQFDSFDPSP